MKPTLPTPNLPLLRKVFEHIEAHPEEWHQGSWGIDWASRLQSAQKFAESYGDGLPADTIQHMQTRMAACGTSFCVAGHATMMTGYLPVWHVGGEMNVVCSPDNGQRFSVSEAAARELGLTDDESTDLFSGANDLDDLHRIGAKIAARAGEVL